MTNAKTSLDLSNAKTLDFDFNCVFQIILSPIDSLISDSTDTLSTDNCPSSLRMIASNNKQPQLILAII